MRVTFKDNDGNTTEIAESWDSSDIIDCATDWDDRPNPLNAEEVGKVLDVLLSDANANTDINWDTIRECLDKVKPTWRDVK